MARRRDCNAIDWNAVERDYRVNKISVAMICQTHKVSRSAVLGRAAKEGWERNMAEAVMVATQVKLMQETVKVHKQSQAEKIEERAEQRVEINQRINEIIEDRVAVASEYIASGIDVAAAANVQVVMAHRRDLVRLKAVSFKMLGELEDITNAIPEIHVLQSMVEENNPESSIALAKVVSLTNRVANIEKLTTSFGRIVSMERQAFGLDEDGKNKADTSVEEILRAAQQGA